MEAISPVARPGNRERGFSDTFAARPRAFNDRDSLQHGFSPSDRENRSPSSVPKGLENMLKTTTETGDIGMFSIKPSRVPQSLTTPRRMGSGLNELGIQKTRQPFSPYGVPAVDDRRQLPSYTRDNSSEVLSMYETGSQKSASRTFDDPDYRSYSMTQTSYSSYTLSNHRSYTSLRSQHDGNGPAQRPRSPFAYPARLRRPGFRPSSPALTDGGIVDYSRRVEIDRAYGAGQNTASPSSLYAQRRKPPLFLRHEANRSTPSLLSQNSPPRRSSSPLVLRQNGFGMELQRRNATASGNTSPARSTLSLASTVNLYNTAPIPSATTTPGKIHPPSPLYYDYTEEFEVEATNQPQVLSPPPQFRIEKTIPEDRPMSADGPAVEEPHSVLAAGDNQNWPRNHASFRQSRERGIKSYTDGTDQTPIEDSRPSSSSVRESSEKTIDDLTDTGEHKKVIRLSGLGYGARELSCRVEEAFGLPSSTSFVIDVSKTAGREPEKRSMLREPGDAFESEKEALSARTSSYSIVSQFPQFPVPPGFKGGVPSPAKSENIHSGPAQKDSRNSRRSFESWQGLDEKNPLRRTRESQCIPPSGRPRARSSGLNSVDTGLAELAQLIDSTNKPLDVLQRQAAPSSSKSSVIWPLDRLAKQSHPQRLDSRQPLPSSRSQQRGKELQMLVERQPAKRSTERIRRINPLSLSTNDAKEVPNFSHQIPHKVIARSESPMLAPKPISPARQLKLKNSIPQIMKALPALPPEPPHANIAAEDERARIDDTKSVFSPTKVSEVTTSSGNIVDEEITTQVAPELPALQEGHADLSKPESSRDQSNFDTTDQNSAKTSVPRMKLKVKSSTAFQPVMPSKPWSLKEEEQSIQETCVLSSSVLSDRNASIIKQPKFRLRVIRASDSTLGTVRVTRDNENTDSQGDGGGYPSNPKDLFTPSPGLENIFRQFGRHLHSHSRKSSANSHYQGEESEPIFSRTDTPSLLDGSPGGNAVSGPPSGGIAPVETRSVFSDDSSQAQGHHSLRKRIHNLRARIAVPYTAKSGSQSYDDITWKDRHGIHILPPAANQSDSNLHDSRRSSEIKPMRRLVEKLHRQRLKAKVRNWINGARSVIARVRPKNSRAGSRSGNK